MAPYSRTAFRQSMLSQTTCRRCRVRQGSCHGPRGGGADRAVGAPRGRTRQWSRRPTAFAPLRLPGAAYRWRSAVWSTESQDREERRGASTFENVGPHCHSPRWTGARCRHPGRQRCPRHQRPSLGCMPREYTAQEGTPWTGFAAS
jgi:hypothetical protein